MDGKGAFKVLLVEPSNLLRRTVSLTVRGLGAAEVTEAATYASALQLCERRRFDAVVVALEWPQSGDEINGLTLVRQIRAGQCAVASSIPIAVMVQSCSTELLQILRTCELSRVLIKPFRVRDVIETIDNMRERAEALAR